MRPKSYWSLWLDSYLDRWLSIKVYETQFLRVVFHPICEYVFRISFLTTLKIYKDYFKDRQRLHNCTSVKQSLVHANFDQKQNFPWFIFFLKKLLCLYTVGFCNQWASWSSLCDELKNFAANILLKFVIKSRIGSAHLLVSHVLGAMYWKMRDCHYRTSPIIYWGKGSIVGWYKVLWFLYL